MPFDRIAYYKMYRTKYKERLKGYKQAYEQRIRERLFRLLGEKCVRCGFSDKRALQIDHINGDGHYDKHRCRASSVMHRRVCDSIERGEKRYQLLCANCNWIKRVERGEQTRYVPHRG